MKVRTRSRLILVATLVIFLVILSFITQSVILQSFRTIEDQETTAHVQRFIAQLNYEVEDVAATCRDWAVREETSGWKDGFPEDPSRLFPPVSMKNLNIDYIVVYDADGNLVFSETITKDGRTILSIPPELDGIVRESIVIESMPGGISGRRGISAIGGDPVILAGYPIQFANPSGDVAGTLVMARLLDEEWIGSIDQMLQTDGTLVPYQNPDTDRTLTAEDKVRAKDGAIIVRSFGEDTQAGYAIITGIENNPSFLLLKIESTRPVFQQVQKSILIVATAIIFISIVFLLVVQLLLQRYILAPLSELDNGMKSIGRSGDLTRRMPEQGDEEILSVTQSLNQMLSQIQQQRDDLRDLIEEIEQQRDDLTKARTALAERNRDLEELNRKANLYLDIYLDAITYEILNAIMGLRGYAELVRDTAEDSEHQFSDKIIALAKKSDNVIRNIETISRIYKNPPEIKPVDLASIIKKETDSRTGTPIHMEHCNRTVLANEMLGVVFDNLFSNSIKFGGDNTKIVVSTRDTPDGLLELSVSDNGPGIPDSMKPLVFDRFMEDTRKRSSYGLGLHIVKMLIESFGGRVRADNRIAGEPQSGAAIRFTLKPA
ncbi:MAG: ATP-binding protein [Methanoregula sp.]|jgi:signal transduction histidine kinase|nr:ATP-binding protein [Methanoregula sp.]